MNRHVGRGKPKAGPRRPPSRKRSCVIRLRVPPRRHVPEGHRLAPRRVRPEQPRPRVVTHRVPVWDGGSAPARHPPVALPFPCSNSSRPRRREPETSPRRRSSCRPRPSPSTPDALCRAPPGCRWPSRTCPRDQHLPMVSRCRCALQRYHRSSGGQRRTLRERRRCLTVLRELGHFTASICPETQAHTARGTLLGETNTQPFYANIHTLLLFMQAWSA